MCSQQWRIQDFLWGANLVGGVPTPKAAMFRKIVCQNERIGTHRERAPAVPPGSANGQLRYVL